MALTGHHYKDAIDFASKLVQEQFGEPAATVFRLLACKGQSTLGEVMRGAGLPPPLVKQALLTLIQHNCADAFTQPGEETFKGSKPSYHVYAANLDRALQIIRHPRFLLHVLEEMGKVAEAIIYVLLVEGRLRFEQILASVAAKLELPLEEADDKVRPVLLSMINSRYVERSPPCGIPPPVQRPHPDSVRTRKSARSGSEGYAADQAAALRSLEEVVYDRSRFKVPTHHATGSLDLGTKEEAAAAAATADELAAAVGDGDAADAGGGAPAVPAGAGGGSRKRGAAAAGVYGDDGGGAEGAAKPAKKGRIKAGTAKPTEPPPGTAGAATRAPGGAASGPSSNYGSGAGGALTEPVHVLWRVNNEEFNRRFRHQAIVGLIADKFDSEAATVVAAVLSYNRAFEGKLQVDRSAEVSEVEVARLVDKPLQALADAAENGAGPEGGGAPKSLPSVAPGVPMVRVAGDKVPSVLRTLASDMFEMLTQTSTGPGGDIYTVNMGRIVDVIKLTQLEGVVRSKFGQPGLRVFKLLLMHNALEQKQIADLGMLPPKDTRELLYNMLAAGFLEIQDIPKTSDRAPSRTFYAWRVNMQACVARVAAQLYRAAARTWLRLSHEINRSKELVEIVDRARTTGQVNFNLTPAQRTQFLRLKKVSEVLETSLQHVDSMIAVFNDY